MPYRMPSIFMTMQAMGMVKMAFKMFLQDESVLRYIFLILYPSNFRPHSQIAPFCPEQICIDRNYVQQVHHPKWQPQIPYIYCKKWPWTQIFEGAHCIGRIIYFKVQILYNSAEKNNLLSMICVSTDLLYAELSHLGH